MSLASEEIISSLDTVIKRKQEVIDLVIKSLLTIESDVLNGVPHVVNRSSTESAVLSEVQSTLSHLKDIGELQDRKISDCNHGK